MNLLSIILVILIGIWFLFSVIMIMKKGNSCGNCNICREQDCSACSRQEKKAYGKKKKEI